MDYLRPKEISDKLKLSLKTVYNHLTKYGDKIEKERRDGKTFVNFVSFVNTLQNWLQNYKADGGGVDGYIKEEEGKDDFVSLQNRLQSLQSDFEGVQSKKNDLEKYNNNLQDQITKYALILSEERNEKKEAIQKNDELQNLYTGKIEEFGKERVKFTKKVYLLAWLLIASVLIIVGLVIYRFFL